MVGSLLLSGLLFGCSSDPMEPDPGMLAQCPGPDCACDTGACVCSSGIGCLVICADVAMAGSACDVDCTLAECGDGYLNPLAGEICDTGGPSPVCGPTCQLPTCDDGAADGQETGNDCGGPDCGPCPAGEGCFFFFDCIDLNCGGGVCQAPTCGDGIQNGDESGVDCGGSACPPC